ncbi:MAG: hypothetical protein LBQ77_03035 [Treponema sp.]|jgi:hypothetical protein|nr:hypothetical protein [Treponema sp.]
MKKSLYLGFVTLAVAMSLVLTGCPEKEPDPEPAGPSAKVSNVTIAGKIEPADTTPFAPVGKLTGDTEFTITLDGDTFIETDEENHLALKERANIKSWFAGVPGGLTVKVLEDVKAGATKVTGVFAGAPTVGFAKPFEITIPGDALTSGKNLTVTENTKATFAIAKATVNAAVEIPSTAGADASSFGTVGPATIVIKLVGTALAEAIDADGVDASTWFKAASTISSSIKFTAKKASKGATQISIDVSGSPTGTAGATDVLAADLAFTSITIPGDLLTTEEALKVNDFSKAIIKKP